MIVRKDLPLEPWVVDMDKRCEEQLAASENQLSVRQRNARMLDKVFAGLWKKCGNPFCKWPISSLPMKNFSTPDHGDVCATCHDLWSAVTFANPQLTNTMYFVNAHSVWKRGGDDGDNWRNKRDKLGL